MVRSSRALARALAGRRPYANANRCNSLFAPTCKCKYVPLPIILWRRTLKTSCGSGQPNSSSAACALLSDTSVGLHLAPLSVHTPHCGRPGARRITMVTPGSRVTGTVGPSVKGETEEDQGGTGGRPTTHGLCCTGTIEGLTFNSRGVPRRSFQVFVPPLVRLIIKEEETGT